MTEAAQGMVYVTQDGGDLTGGSAFLTPDRAGALRVIAAQGQRLILLSTSGKTFYFDVPGLQFTTSLNSIVPTVRSLPTPSSLTATLVGDARHKPDDLIELNPIKTPLRRTIIHAGDEHWFRFSLSAACTIQVHFDNVPANYDLYVFSMTRVHYAGHDGKSTNPGTTSELVTIENAPADDY